MIYGRKLSLVMLAVLSANVVANPVENYDSGRTKLEKIMANEETGVAAYNKHNIKYAEIQNLATDLNVAEIAKFFGCKTIVGQSYIEETLKFPVAPQDKDTVLARRQGAIKTLVNSPALKQEIEKLLEVAKQAEQEVIILLSDLFKGQNCPDNANLELIKKQNPYLYPLFKKITFSQTARTVVAAVSTIATVTATVSTPVWGLLAYNQAMRGEFYGLNVLWSAYSALVSGIGMYGCHQDYKLGSAKRNKMHALNQLITIAERFEELCADFGVNNQFAMSDINDPEGTALLHGLKHPRYQHKNTMFFMTPSVHTFLYKIYEQEKHLAKMFACIAEMDAYNAIANKIIESQQSKNKFCFATFVEDSKPVIKAQEYWNVLVKNAVTNSICQDKQIILTGPNAGGKTTTIRAIVQNIVLGQSFGVAAAELFEFTMFDVIHAYLNISDDLLNGLSLFASEVKRRKNCYKELKH